MKEKVEEVINNLRPYLNSEGGNIELIKIEDNIVYIKLTGACGHCQFQDNTINNGILRAIQEVCPEIKDVINTDI